MEIISRAILELILNNKRKPKSGFTYLELIIAIVIILIVTAGVAALSGPFMHRQQVEYSVAKLAADLRQTQQFARSQRDGYKYFGLRFYNGLGEKGDREGWEIVQYCTKTGGVCTSDPTLPILLLPPTDFAVIKSSKESDNPEFVENTFFDENVKLDATSEFQLNNFIVFTPEGSATSDGQTLLGAGNDDIKLSKFGNIKTITIAPLTGNVKIQ